MAESAESTPTPSESNLTCPRCGSSTSALKPVDTGTRLALQSTGMQEGEIPPAVCGSCIKELGGKISQGMKLRIERVNRDKNRAILWKGRVQLIKEAQEHMRNRQYAQAAISYEKYLRSLEIVFNKKKGELSPEVFNNSRRSKEVTVISSVLWDLVRIYDNSPRYTSRMKEAADKLAQFLPLSTIHQEVAKAAEGFLKQSKNPQIVKDFMRATKISIAKCFIASAVFEDPEAPEVLILRQFRDQRLKRSSVGRGLVRLYETVSPPLARSLRGNQPSRQRLRKGLRQSLSFTAGQLRRWT